MMSGLTCWGRSQNRLLQMKSRYPQVQKIFSGTGLKSSFELVSVRRATSNSLKKNSKQSRSARYTTKFTRCTTVNSQCMDGRRIRKAALKNVGYRGLQ